MKKTSRYIIVGKAVSLVDWADYDTVASYQWKTDRTGYARTSLGKTSISMHRLIMQPSKTQVIDHLNWIRLDNRRVNLRACLQQENSQRQRKQTRKTSSQYKGVSWHKAAKKWMAYLKTNHKRYYLGLHISEDAAAQAYNSEATKRFGEFAHLNRCPVGECI